MTFIPLLALSTYALAQDEETARQIDNGDGTWSFATPAGLRVGDQRVEGVVTWEYDGQVAYNWDPYPMGPRWIDAVSERRLVGGVAAFENSVRYDDAGGKWLVAAVDTDALRGVVERYNTQYPEPAALEDFDPLTSLDVAIDGEWVDVEEEGYEWTPNGWTHPTCSGITYNVLDSDTRDQRISLNARQETAVLVVGYFLGGATSVCSGVLIDVDNVLTSAHCVVDFAEVPIPAADITVCTFGNAYSGASCDTAASSVIINSGWTGSGDPSDDLAVIDVGAGWSGAETMGLSVASDSTVTAFDMHNIAFPSHAPATPSCTSSTPPSEVDSDEPRAHFLSHAMSDISAPITTATFHFNHDGGPGHSGSPVYYCGGSSCDAGETGLVVSIWSGWNGVATAHVGPKIHNFRTWILGLI